MRRRDDDLQVVLVQLATIAGDVKSVLLQLETHDQQGKDHERRIRQLERALWVATGLAAAGGGAIGSLASRIGGS